MNATTTSPAARRDAKAIACIAFWNASESVTRAKWLGRPSDNDSTSPARVTGIEYDRKTSQPVPRIRGVGHNLPAILTDLYPNLGIGVVTVQLKSVLAAQRSPRSIAKAESPPKHPVDR